jgi:hypothetical protein
MSYIGGPLPGQEENTQSGQWYNAPLWALNKWGEGVDWSNDQVTLRNALMLNPVTRLLPQPDGPDLMDKVLDYSYKDLRDDASSGAGRLATRLTGSEAVGQGVELAGQILLPDAMDFATGGVGYLDNLAKIPKALRKVDTKVISRGGSKLLNAFKKGGDHAHVAFDKARKKLTDSIALDKARLMQGVNEFKEGVEVLKSQVGKVLGQSDELALQGAGGLQIRAGGSSGIQRMEMQQGYKWISEGGELDQELSKILKVGKGKKAKPITYEELVKRAETSPSDKNKLDKYHSLIATGPAQNADDVLQYGFLGNKEARTALMKGDPNYSAQLDKSMDFHHKGMKALQAKIHMRARQLRSAGKATDDDILNLHALTNAAGVSSGSRVSAGKWMHGLPHNILHKKLMLPKGIQPDQTIWSTGKLKGKPSAIPTPMWKAAKEIGADTRFDLDYIKTWSDTIGLEAALKKWKAFKSNKKLYELYSPDGLSEIDRIVNKMDNMDIQQLTKLQQELIEDIYVPMTKEADLLEDFALKRYTPKQLHDLRIDKGTSKATKEYLEDQQRLADIKKVLEDRKRSQLQ